MTTTPRDAICSFVPPFLRYLREGVAKVNLSPARFQILQALGGGSVLSMVELARRLSVTKRNITTLIDGLENDGLAKRVPHPTDRRSKLVYLTEAGETLFEEATEVQREHLEKLLSHLDPLHQEELGKGLSLLTQAMVSERSD